MTTSASAVNRICRTRERARFFVSDGRRRAPQRSPAVTRRRRRHLWELRPLPADCRVARPWWSSTDEGVRAALRRAVTERGAALRTVVPRLATAREADRVVVIEGGRIVEDGPPSDLGHRGGPFAALLELESTGWDMRVHRAPTGEMELGGRRELHIESGGETHEACANHCPRPGAAPPTSCGAHGAAPTAASTSSMRNTATRDGVGRGHVLSPVRRWGIDHDNGATWAKNLRVSDRSVDRRIGIWANGYDVSVPPGLASTNALAVVAWDDTRNGTLTVHAQDLYSSIIQHETVSTGGMPTAVQAVIAAVGGLVVVGLALAVAGRASRLRAGSPAPSRNPDDRTVMSG